MTPVLEIVANGDNVALIARNYSDFGTPLNGSIQSIWHYDSEYKTVKLTYKHQAE